MFRVTEFRRRLLRGVACCWAVAAVLPGIARAEDPYPVRPVTIVAPFAPGSTIDILARIVARKLSESLGQNFIVENRAGADGNIGTAYVAAAKPDGYILLLGATSTNAVNPTLHRNLKFDASKSFVPISSLASVANVLVVGPGSPANSVKEFIDLASRQNLSYASGGAGGSMHLAGELFKSMTGTDKLLHVPYKGGGPALNDLLGGQVDAMFCNLPVCLPQIKAGRLKALGVTSLKRSPLLPGVPTLAESGVPGYLVEGWYGLFGPLGMLAPIVQKLNAATVKLLQDPKVVELLLAQGATALGDTPEAFGAFVQREHDRWAEVIRRAGITAD
jgi:tripartite-type tricarboxylate transporter receptor subunit TctC